MNFYKCAVAGLSMLAATFTVSAQTEYTETLTVGTYSVENQQYADTITPGQTKYIPVNISLSQDNITGLQFDIRHSAGISLTKKIIKNPDVMPAGDQVIITPEVSTEIVEGEKFVLSRVMVVASKSEALKAMEGTLMQIEIAAAEDAFNRFPKLELEVENIVMTAPGDNGDGIGLYAPDMSSYVVMGIDKLALSSPDENLEIMPGGECTITVAMENSVKVAGLEANIVLPEGFTLKGYETGDAISFCERAKDGDFQLFDRGEGVYHLLAFRYDGDNLTDSLSGNLFTFTVVAPETLEGNDFNVTFDKFVISFGSMENTVSYEGKGMTVNIANGMIAELNRRAANEAAYQEDLAVIAELQAALDEAVAQIREEHPDYDVETAAAGIQEMIDAQKAQAEAALAAVETEGVYENTVDGASVLDAIETMRQEAVETGIGNIEIEDLVNARIYTATGVQVSEPVKGSVNIIVLENGKVVKLHIR